MIELDKYQREINRICQKYRVKNLTVFGSTLSDRFDDSSDIDFLLELSDAQGGIKRYMNIKFELEGLFSRPVDLVMPKAINNQLLKDNIYANTRVVYGT